MKQLVLRLVLTVSLLGQLALVLVFAIVLLASCASVPNGTSTKMCSDTPHGVVKIFFEAIAEFNLFKMGGAIAEGLSMKRVFGNNDPDLGEKVIQHILANPEVPGEHGCACKPLETQATDDPDVKIVWAKRMVGDNNYKRSFRVRLQPQSNCILSVDPREKQWILM